MAEQNGMREQSSMGTREGMREQSSTREGRLKTRSASFGKRVVKEVSKAGKKAALKVRRMRAATLTFEQVPQQSHVARTFAIVSKLGEGGYSTIWSVRERQPDGAEVEYAVKRVLIDGSDSEQLSLVESEIGAMRSLPPHPNLVTLLGFCRKPRAPGGGGRSGLDEFYLLLEMCAGGSLAGMLQRRDREHAPLRPAETLRIFLDLCHAVAHMHALPQPLAHRDVKPENLVFSTEDGCWKLCGRSHTHAPEAADPGPKAAAPRCAGVTLGQPARRSSATPRATAPPRWRLRRSACIASRRRSTARPR